MTENPWDEIKARNDAWHRKYGPRGEWWPSERLEDRIVLRYEWPLGEDNVPTVIERDRPWREARAREIAAGWEQA